MMWRIERACEIMSDSNSKFIYNVICHQLVAAAGPGRGRPASGLSVLGARMWRMLSYRLLNNYQHQ